MQTVQEVWLELRRNTSSPRTNSHALKHTVGALQWIVGTYQSLHGRSLYLPNAKAAVKFSHRWFCALVGKKAMQSKSNQDWFFLSCERMEGV